MTARTRHQDEQPGPPLWTWNYTLYIAGLVISNSGTWVQRIAQSWLVLEITNGDGSALGVTTALQFTPVLLLGAWGGVMVDRLPKRQLVMVTQIGMGFLALALAVLTTSGTVAVWHIYLLAALLGVLNVFDNPARNSLLNEIVGRANLARAIGLSSACFNVARMAGPSLGGVLVGTAGAGIAFGINAASYGVVIVCLCLMRTKEMTLSPLVARQKGQLREGIRYVVGRRDLVIAMLVIAVVNSFAMNFQLTVALISREALGLSASAYGVLFGAVGAGSICGALLAARRRRPRMRVVVVAAVALGVLEICCSLASGFWVLLVLLFVVGACSLSVSNSTNAIVQLGAAPALRGRVLSLYFLSVSGGRPVGGFVLGLIASLAGPSWPMGIGGLIAMLSGLGAALWLMARRRSQTT